MKYSELGETISIAFGAIRANKLRSMLAALGVVIGISFVILMGWVLSGLDKALTDTINLIGADMLYVDKWDWAGGKSWKLIRQRKDITYQQAKELCDRITTAELAVPIARNWNTSVKYGNDLLEGINVQGTLSDYGLTPGGEVVQGRFFSKIEDNTSANVCVLGHGVSETLFPNGDAVGKIIKINGFKFTVVGVVKKQATIAMDFLDKMIYMPLRTFLGTFGHFRRSFNIAVKAGSEKYLDEVRAEAEGLMRIIRNLHPTEENDFSINETKAFESLVVKLRLYVWGIGIGMTVLSFIVGIIGIMNIMFVSVTERTKEIGIRKALGAPKRSILIQFIVESATLCFAGALIAFIACSVLVYAIATYLPMIFPQANFLNPYIPIELLTIATVVSVIVGIMAGIIPAYRASRLDPVDALRYE